VDYHRDWVCRQSAESCLCRPRNGHNFVQKSRLPKDLTLVNVLNVLDSGYYEYHFPNPPFPRPTRGGFTMARP